MKLKCYTMAIMMLCLSVITRAQQPRASASSVSPEKAMKMLNQVQTGFTMNKGQLKDQDGKQVPGIRYLLRMPGLNVQLRQSGFSYDAYVQAAGKKTQDLKFHRVDIDLEGANPQAKLVAEAMVTGSRTQVINEYGTFTDVYDYGKVTYQDIYPGIDLEFIASKGKEKPVEYNFIVHPGADASLIKLKYNNGNDITLKDGKINMPLAFGTLVEKIPASYTAQDGKALAVHYMPEDAAKGIYAFHVPAYDRRKTLVIDPTPNLVWATYYAAGETASFNTPTAGVRVDNQGNVFIAGQLSTVANVATAGTFLTTYQGGYQDSYCAKFSPAGVRLWGTIVGAAAHETLQAMAIDNSGNVFVGGVIVYGFGVTGIGTAGTHQPNWGGGYADGFLIKLNGANGTRMWGTFLGSVGSGNDYSDGINALHVLPDNNVLAAGFSDIVASTNLAFGTGNKLSISGAREGFLTKLNGSTGVGMWGTYIGGTGDEEVRAITNDAAGNIYVAGETNSDGLATSGALQTARGATGTTKNMFIARFSSNGGTRAWCTYYGGTGGEMAYDLIIDKNNELLVGGSTFSTGLTTPGAYAASGNGIVMKMALSGSRIWATKYPFSMLRTLAVDESNEIYLFGTGAAGVTAASCGYQPQTAGSTDLFLAKISAAGDSSRWATYFGGTAAESTNGSKNMAYGGSGQIYIYDQTLSTGLATSGTTNSTLGNDKAGILAKFSTLGPPENATASAQTLAPLTQNVCILGIPANIVGNAVSVSNLGEFATPVYYQWQVADSLTGAWSNMPGEVFKDLTPLAGNTNKYYRRQVYINDVLCSRRLLGTSPVSAVIVGSNAAPIADASGPQWFVCSGTNSTSFTGTATGGSGVYSSYQWYAGSDLTTTISNVAALTVTNLTASTTYTLKVTDNAGCSDVDQVTIVPVATANAGVDKSYCQGSPGVSIGTAGVAGLPSTAYSWTILSGTPGSLSCTGCAMPVVKPSATTRYRLVVTVPLKGGGTCTSADTVDVAYVATPLNGPELAGPDKAICKNSTTILGVASSDATTYTWAPGTYLSATNVLNPTFNAGTNPVMCPLTYTLTAVKSGCSFTDQVSVSVINAATKMDGQTMSCTGWAEHDGEPNCTNATYSWVLVSGPGVVPAGSRLRNGGSEAYLTNTGAVNAVYRRVTTINGVNCNSGNITVAPCAPGSGCIAGIKMLSPQGCPKVFGQQELQLYAAGANANDYTFSWTPANIMDNPTAPVVNITSTAPARVVLVITNKYTGGTCSDTLQINNPAWSRPVLNTPDKNTCPGTAVTIGEPFVAGYNYTWTPAAGLNNTLSNNPTATLADSRQYKVVKTDAVNGCKTEDDVVVNVAGIDFDAGPARAVCNGATVTLGTTPGGSYTYSWTPAGAAWTNGTGPTNANPQVLFASSTQTFNVTVTNPLTGCSITDAVTLRSNVLAGEYAGSPVTVCGGEQVQLGTTPQPLATYSWTPATGLSCTNCANPILTATATQSYAVQVSYPGCTVPMTDNIAVTVNAVPAVTLVDKTICPTNTTIGIGIGGGGGNTATLANVTSYLWSPSTGLSCVNCANPIANPQITTTYSVLITFTNGCTLTKTVTVTPTLVATAKPDASICPGASVVLGSPSASGVTYAWTLNPSGSAAATLSCVNCAQPVASPTATTEYKLTASISGCSVTDVVRITVKPIPALTVTATNQRICQGTAITLSGNPSTTTGVTYQWTPTTGLSTPNARTTSVTPTQSATYRLVQTDLTTGCSNYGDISVTVVPNTMAVTAGNFQVCSGTKDTMPLVITPAAGNYAVSWSPVTDLSDPFTQRPVVSPTAIRLYTATVTDLSNNCTRTATSVVTMSASCLGTDYGDAPAVYEKSNAARHTISNLLKIGAATDGEIRAESAVMNALAIGDDNNNQVNDEEGISFLPLPTTATKTMGIVVNNVLNNTGQTGYLVGWMDFNRDGDFDDIGERSQILTLSSSATATDPVIRFADFNNGCVVKAGLSYLRVRLTTDTTGDWHNSPSPNGLRADGEVEDYSLTLMGTDFGDAPVAYPAVRASVYPDLDNDGQPDAAGSVWLGNRVDYDYSCDYVSSSVAVADDNDYSINDEDGLQMSSQVPIGQSVPWQLTVNSQGPVTGAQWGMWIDWNADGTFDNFYNGNVNTASPTPVTVNVTAPSNAIRGFVVRVGVKAPGTSFTADDYNSIITNGEWEDHIRVTPLPVRLAYFNAGSIGCNGEVSWATANEYNSAYFELERSTDGINWKAVKRIAASGVSSVEQSYKTAVGLESGVNNYLRLKMVDKNGDSEYSMLRVLRCDALTPILVWPNPAKTQVQISGLPARAIVSLVDVSGKEVKRLAAANATEVISVESLIPGTYQVIISDESGHRLDHQKLIKQ